MKKLIYSLVLFLFAVSTVGNTVFASSEVIKPSEEILTEIEDIANNYESIELIDVDELPKGTPFIYFDTVEDFEKSIKELDEENKNIQVDVYEETNYLSLSNQLITTMAATSSTVDRLKVVVKPSLNPLKALIQPVNITVDLDYSYTGSGNTLKFSAIKKVNSHSLGIPSNWVQTSDDSYFYDFAKGVHLDLFGYHEVGIVVKGLPLGAKVDDVISFKYRIGGSKGLVAE